jgi:hypothetical protein
MYEGYQKTNKIYHWISIGYWKNPEGIENIRRVSEMYQGYGNVPRVSEN